MKFSRFLTLIVIWSSVIAIKAETNTIASLPHHIYCENDEVGGHVQGVAVDIKKGVAYFSFTTKLIKTDLKGNILGTVTGLTCHLGCLDLDPENGKLYASVEYKDDEIGKNIMKMAGKKGVAKKNSFYIGIFDTEKITEKNMNAETSGVMKTVYLPTVVKLYEDTIKINGKKVAHRYGCSGIDGIGLGPEFGKKSEKKCLLVDVAVYDDITRSDNDYQLLLKYDPNELDKYATVLDQQNPHTNGPKKADEEYFVYTGNTAYGIQNLEYNPSIHCWLAAVYKGKKPFFQNYSLFAIDGSKTPVIQKLKGFKKTQKGKVLSLAPIGEVDAWSGVRGWKQELGACGLESIGNGYFYISHPGVKDNHQFCDLRLYHWVGNTKQAFEEVGDKK